MASKSILCALLPMLVGSLALSPSHAQQPTMMMMRIQSVPTPNFEGKTLEQVRAAAVLPNGNPMFVEIYPEGPSGGVVVSQSPQPKTPIVPGKVRLLVTLEVRRTIPQQIIDALVASNSNRPQTQVPNLYGLTRTAASAALEKARLGGRFGGEESGVVAEQSPQAGDSVPEDSTVNVTLAIPRVVVPSLVGKTLDLAEAQLTDDRLQVGNLSGDTSAGSLVQAQSIPPGSEVERNTPVDLTLGLPSTSDGPPKSPEQVAVPNLIGMDPKTAGATLKKVGLVPRFATKGLSGRVIGQKPEPGDLVDPGAIVQISFSAKLPSPPPRPPEPRPVHWARRARPVLGFLLILGVLGVGFKGAIGFRNIVRANAEIRKIRSRSLHPADIHVVTAKTVPKIPTEGKRSPSLRFVLRIREGASVQRVSANSDPSILRKEKSDVSSD